MTQPQMAPTTGDAPTLTLAAAVLLADQYPRHLTSDARQQLASDAVDAVMIIWDEIQKRIASGILVNPIN